jgi:hypothetical protein
MANETQIYVGKLGAQTLYKRLKQLIGRITTYKKVPADEQGHPVESNPDSRTIYLVKDECVVGEDKFFEWIWTAPNIWECIGTTSEPCNSWKQWSEENGSSGEGDSVYIGKNNDLGRDESYSLGQDNTVEVTDDTDYTDTDIVEIGTSNTATNAANTYQLGRENSVTGNNLAYKDTYPHSMALNLGRNNTINGEGVNIGKDNVSSTFGVTVGQRNQATHASIAIGEDVDSYYGSISIGHGKPSETSSELSMLSMTVDGEEIPAQRIKLDLTEYTYYASASVFKTASNTYEWGEIGEFSTRVTLYENQALHTYLVGGNSASSGRVTGYFDSNGNFISSTDQSYNIKEYSHITAVNGVPVDFYCSRENGNNVAVSGYFKKSETQPDYGTVLNASEYAEWLQKLSISDNTYDNINVYTADLTAPAMKCKYSGTNRPFYTKYSVYGYRDENNRFIPYNEATKYKSDAFAWETISADDVHTSQIKPESIGVTAPNTISRNDSIAIGKSMEADSSSFGVGIGTIKPEITYEKESEANHWIGYTSTSYRTLTISQVDGSVTESTWTEYYRVWFNNKVEDVSWNLTTPARSVMGNSIAILNAGSNESLDNYLSGASVGIGNGLKLTDNSFGFGTNLEGDNNSVLVGANLTAQVGGSTLVGRDISVKIGDSDNDGGSISDEYDGGLVAFGMSIAPSPGSVTVGRSGVTTGRGSVAVGASGLSAKRGGVVYGRNGVTAEGRATAIGTDGISSKNASISVGLDCTNAEDGSAAFGINGISAYSGSISVGRDGNSARSGSLALGFTNLAESGSTSVGARSVARGGAFTFGRGMSAESAGISIGTTGGNQASRDRSAMGSIVKYKNPDNIFVPVRGSIRVKTGYSIDHVRVFRNVSYNGTTYDYAVLGIDSGYYNSNFMVYLYKNGTEAISVDRTSMRNAFSTASEEYWRITNGTSYSFVRFVAEKTYNELSNLKNLKEYLEINPQTFIQNEQVYVYADGFNYPTTGRTTNNWIPLSSCTFDVYDYWTGVMLGYSAGAWNQLTASGGYNKGIAIGANAHAEGCSFAMAPNYDVMDSSSTVSIGNRLYASSNGLPTSLLYDIDYNGNSISANGYSAAIGIESITATGHSFALGNQSLRAYGHSTAIGTDGVYADRYSLSIGCKTNDAYNYSFAIGQNSNFATGNSFAIGTNSNTASGCSLAIGTNSNQARDYSLAIGDGNNAETYSSVFGYNSKAYHSSIALGKYASAFDDATSIGINTRAYNSSTAIGDGIAAYDYSFGVGRWGTAKNNSVSVGESNYTDHYSLAMGRWNNSDNRSVAMGDNNQSSDYAVTMGRDNTARGENVAIGIRNSVSRDAYSGCHGIAIGEGNTSKEGGYNISFGLNNASSREAVSIGTGNNVHGWSIAVGVNNTSYDGPGGHATMIGQSNTSTSNQESIHKEYQIYIYNEPTQEQIDELNGREAAYRRLIDPYLDSETIASLNTADACNNDYYLGRSDEMAWGYYSYFSWLQTLGNQPPFILSSSDKAALAAIMQQQPQTVEDYKTLILQVCGIVQNYANVDELRTLVNAATTIDDLNAIWSTQLWRDIGISMQWSGDPIPGVVSDYNALQQILVAYRSWNDYGLSLRSSAAPHYETIEEDVVCNSFLVGNNNTSNHYNSILIGSLNESQAPLVQPDATDHTTDDDGFMLAIGYRNVVGRNYDIAVGYKSTANGGENVAIQHSVAGNGNNTFHNLAMFNSTAYGTGNVALQDSSVTDGFTNFTMFNSSINGGILNFAEGNSIIDVGKLVGTSSAQNVYANMLSVDSRLANVSTTSLEHMQKNRLFSSNVDTCQRMSYNDFFVSNVNFTKQGGAGIYYNLLACNGRFDNSGDRRPIPFVVDAPTYQNNILFGNRTGSISVTEFNRNVVLQPRDNDGSYWMNWRGTQAADNFLFGHQVQGWFGGDGMYDNVIMNSRLTGSIDNEFVQNVMLARSIVKVNTTGNVTQSFLFNAGLTFDDTLRNTQTNSTQNALFNCTVKNSSQVFVFGFGDDAFDSEYTEYQSMNCTWRTVAFGDNKVDETCDSFLFGSDNKVEYTHETTVFGRMNNLLNYSIDDYGERDYVKMGGNKVFGSKNELTNGSGELSRSIVIGDSNSIFAVGKTNDNKIIGSNNTISGGSDPSVTVTNPKFVEEFTEKTFFTSTSTGCINTGDTQSYVNSPYGSSSYFYYLYSNGYLSGYQWDYAVPDSVKYSAIEKSTTQLRNDYNNSVLIDGMWYKVPGGQSSAYFSQPIVKGFVAWKDTSYYFNGETVKKVTGYSSGARYTYRNTIIGTDNYLGNNVSDYFILGKSNQLSCNDYLDHATDYTISTGFIQGNNNTAKNGSNIVCMGNGNVSTGHNSTAIGTQLISSQWQTVIGKYNAPIDGATRLDTENPQDPTKALFIIGNGYSQKDDETYWQDESYITRSNAMVVYADGTVRAKKFVSDAPDLELVNGTGITFTDSTSTNTRTVSVSQDLADLISFLNTRPSTGRYAINSINGVLTWVEIGTTGV